MGDINWLAVALASIAGFLVGWLWYGPLFGASWRRETGHDENTTGRPGVALVMGLTFLFGLMAAFMMGHMFARAGTTQTHIFLMMSSGLAAFFVIPALWTSYLYQGKSLKLALIDGGYWLAFYLTMGGVFALLG